jgi:site-specific DNA recombinase
MKLVEYLSGTVVATYHDPEQSGYRRDRPELKKLLRDVETGVVDLVVCEAPDRLARDAEDVAFLGKKLMYHRVALHTVSKGMLTRSSSRSPAGWDLPEASGGQDGTGNGSGRTGGPLCRRPRLRVHSTHAASSFAACSRSTKPRPSSSTDRRRVRGWPVVYPDRHPPQCRRYPRPRGGQWNASTIRGDPEKATGILNNPLYVGRLM